MMTPQEVSEHAFAKASFGGYNMAMVDEFLDLLTEDYTALYKENAVLKSKMKVLVDKVEEYRSTEDAMRKALLTAQRMADEMVAEAEQKRNTMLQTVDAEVRTRRNQLVQEVANEEGRLEAARKATAAYVAKLKELYQHEMDYLRSLDQFTAPVAAEEPVQTAQPEQPAPKAEEPDLTADTITIEVPVEDKSDGGLYAELMELNMNPAEGERHKRPSRQPIERPEAEEPAEEEDDTAPTKRIDFSNLQFGRDYEIK
ncbi:cell division protein DivIVA [Flavonifractor sp. An92]|uniref:DivIVA domain-containing protein n=1 Tax=Flavonifractor sp. An92 TaxID=1965666 RepID=UPI000B38973F|nr:DivIVA domain-containing protein [Flavonifractor sp. An92]OUN05697.1 cell division protein DivIVA [Flavonifractor sp. An92]